MFSLRLLPTIGVVILLSLHQLAPVQSHADDICQLKIDEDQYCSTDCATSPDQDCAYFGRAVDPSAAEKDCKSGDTQKKLHVCRPVTGWHNSNKECGRDRSVKVWTEENIKRTSLYDLTNNLNEACEQNYYTMQWPLWKLWVAANPNPYTTQPAYGPRPTGRDVCNQYNGRVSVIVRVPGDPPQRTVFYTSGDYFQPVRSCVQNPKLTEEEVKSMFPGVFSVRERTIAKTSRSAVAVPLVHSKAEPAKGLSLTSASDMLRWKREQGLASASGMLRWKHAAHEQYVDNLWYEMNEYEEDELRYERSLSNLRTARKKFDTAKQLREMHKVKRERRGYYY